MSGNQNIAVSVDNPTVFDALQNAGIAKKSDVLKAIGASKVGILKVEAFDVKIGSANQNILTENIKPSLPASRVLVLFQLSWTGTEPDIKWNKINGNNSSAGIVLSTLQNSKVSGSDYQFDELMKRGTEYNLQSTQTGVTLDYLLVLEIALGF